MTKDGASGLRSATRRRAWLVAGLVIVALYVAGLALAGVQDALEAVVRADPVPLLGAFVLEVATIAALAMVHRSSAAAVGHPLRYPYALNVSMSAFTLTQSLPGGGAAAAAVVVQRLTRVGIDGPVATASLALTATLTTSTIALIGVVGIVIAFVRGELGGAAPLIAFAVLLVLLLLFTMVIVTIRSPRIGARLLEKLGRIHPRLNRRIHRWRHELTGLTEDPPSSTQLLRIVGWSGVNWAADIAALGLVFVAFGQSVTLTVLLVGFAVSQLAAAIPLSPGGVGFVEGGMVGAFVALGVSLSAATVVVVTYRVLATWLPTLAGFAPLLRPPPVAPDSND